MAICYRIRQSYTLYFQTCLESLYLYILVLNNCNTFYRYIKLFATRALNFF